MEGFEKIPSGTEGLDLMLRGGLISKRPYVISGGPGLGKTILALQYLMAGDPDKKGLYITFDEPVLELKTNMEAFGWDPARLFFLDCTPRMGMSSVDSDSYVMIRSDEPGQEDLFMEFSVANLMEAVRRIHKEYRFERAVVDSITSIKLMLRDELDRRKSIQLLMGTLSELGSTSVLISETGGSGAESFTEMFASRGVIRLRSIDMQNRVKRALQIMKMRSTPYDDTPRPIEISSRGLRVFPDENLF